MNQKLRGRVLTAAKILILVATIGAICYPTILTLAGRFLIDSDVPQTANIIVVLGGDFWGTRVLKGGDLGIQGLAAHVMISGPPYKGKPESELAIEFLVQKGFPREMFLSFAHRATSTIDEAIAVCPELQRLGVHSAILVTRASHSRRAGLVFRLFCPGVLFRSMPAHDEQFQPERWWTREMCKQVFIAEWSKILGTLFWKYPAYQMKKAVSQKPLQTADRLRVFY